MVQLFQHHLFPVSPVKFALKLNESVALTLINSTILTLVVCFPAVWCNLI